MNDPLAFIIGLAIYEAVKTLTYAAIRYYRCPREHRCRQVMSEETE